MWCTPAGFLKPIARCFFKHGTGDLRSSLNLDKNLLWQKCPSSAKTFPKWFAALKSSNIEKSMHVVTQNFAVERQLQQDILGWLWAVRLEWVCTNLPGCWDNIGRSVPNMLTPSARILSHCESQGTVFHIELHMHTHRVLFIGFTLLYYICILKKNMEIISLQLRYH